MAVERIPLGWEVQFQELVQGIRKSGAMAEPEVKKLMDSLRKQAVQADKDMARAAQRAADSAKKAAGEANRAWSETGKKLSTLAGGPVAALGDAIFELGPKASAASAALGGATVAAIGLGAQVAALRAVANAVVGLANAAREAQQSIDAAGRSELVTAEDRAILTEYDAAMRELGLAFSRVTVQVGSDVADMLAVLARAGAWWLNTVADVRQSIDDLLPTFRQLVTSAGEYVGLVEDQNAALDEQLRKIKASVDASLEHATAKAKAAQRERDLDQAQSEAAAEEERRRDNAKRGEAEVAKLKAEAAARARAYAAEQTRAYDVLNEAWADTVVELQAVAREMGVVAKEGAAAGLEATHAGQASHGAWRRAREEFEKNIQTLQGYQDELDGLSQGWTGLDNRVQAGAAAVNKALNRDDVQAVAGALGDTVTLLGEMNADAAASFRERRTEAAALAKTQRAADLERIDRLEEQGQLTAEQARAERKAANDRWDADNQFRRATMAAERKGILQSWRRTKALQIAGALAEGARSAVALIPAFAGSGPFAPALATAVAAPATATAILSIQRQEPPELPTGRTPDHTELVSLRPDEAVLSPGASAALGRDGVDRLQRGLGVGPSTVQLVIDGRVVDTRVAAELGRQQRLRPPGQYAPGKRAVYGGRY